MPRRIKLVVSDFHLGAGVLDADGSRNPMEDFVHADRFVEFIEYYRGGLHAEDEVELIVNGDFFNMLQMEVDGRVPSDVTEAAAVEQLRTVLDGHAEVVEALATFADTPGKSLVFTAGNHDAGLIFPGVQELLRERLKAPVRVIDRAYVFDHVHVEHGDKFEPVHELPGGEPLITKGLSEPVLNLPWASYFFIRFIRPIKRKRPYFDKVTPFRNYLTWGAIYDSRFFFGTIVRLLIFWVHSILRARVGGRRFGPEILPVFLRQLDEVAEMRAAQRILFRERRVTTVVFGHTHHALYRQFAPGREYFNTGCWNQVTNLDIEGYGYRVRLTYAFLEWNEKEHRWSTRLLRWNGRRQVYESFWG